MDTYDPATDTTTPIPWANVTRLVLTLVHEETGVEVQVDSNSDPSKFNYTQDGILKLILGAVAGLEVSARYRARLTAYDATAAKTELLHEAMGEILAFDVKDTSSVP